ncbi:MAG: FAD-binding oxidoreductase [Desulfomonilaceae bacterium]
MGHGPPAIPSNGQVLTSFSAELHTLGIPFIEAGFEDYLRDESRFQGHASGLVRCRDERDVINALKAANRCRIPLTAVSGKTSLTGASVPLGGVILDLKGLASIDPDDPTRVGPGVILKHYKDHIASRGLFYPPDPTSEDSCTLGGNVACNASGPLSYLYGPTRNYIQGLRLALPTGTVLEIERGLIVSNDGVFRVPANLMLPVGVADLLIPVPKIAASDWSFCKNAAGLYSAEPMDLVDLFIGSEGILGIVLQIKTRLLLRRRPYFSVMLYLPTQKLTVQLVTLLNNFKRYFHDGEQNLRQEIERMQFSSTERPGILDLERFRGMEPSCMEWLGSSVAPLLSLERAGKLAGTYGCLYVEQEYPDGEGPLARASQWALLVDMLNGRDASDAPPIEAEVALDQNQIRKMRKDRQSVPEKLNELIRPGMVKIGTDFAVPMEHLGRLLKLYDDTLPIGKSYVFGHIGNAHLHSNILAENDEEMEDYRSLSRELAAEVCKLSGSVSGEHGIGKLKREALETMVGAEGINEIRRIKQILDPHLILNINNMVKV